MLHFFIVLLRRGDIAGKKFIFVHSLAHESLALTAVNVVTALVIPAMLSCQELFLYLMEIIKVSKSDVQSQF